MGLMQAMGITLFGNCCPGVNVGDPGTNDAGSAFAQATDWGPVGWLGLEPGAKLPGA